MLLQFVKSCLRGEAALWWEGCILLYGDDQDQGPAENYVAFKTAFKQHYGIGGATNNLCWADTFCQRSDEDIREYFSRATAELGNHLKESAPLLYRKTYTPVDISGNFKVALTRLRTRQERGLDLEVAFLRDELMSCSRYTDRKMMLLLMDKIVKFDRTDKTRRNPTLVHTTVTQDDPAVIEAVKASQKKGIGKGKGKGKGKVAYTNVAVTFVSTTQNRQQSSANYATRQGTLRASATRSRT
jgi:hypothetical protein